MFKNFLLIIFTLITITSLSGCSLFSSDSEEQETAVAEDSGAEGVEGSTEDSELDEMATTEEGSSTDEATGADTVAAADDEEEVVDEYPDDDYGDETDEVLADDTEEAPTKSEEPVEEKKEESLYVDGSQEETPSYADSSVQDNLTETQNFIPVRKMKKTPYTEGGALINRLYVAREGDTLKSVSQKIYGDSSRSKDLLSWNPHFAGKGLSVGDKVYYSSPKNPQDSTAILLYYEEAGLQPSYYTAKNGESIRKVSQTLLGHPRSWMEVWATNDIESKWEMAEGTQLRYWPNGSVAAPMQAAAPEPTQPEEDIVNENATTTETAAMDTEPTEPMTEQPMDEAPPVDETGAAAAMAQNEEPPPPPPEATPPPPPPPPEAIPTPEGTDMAANGEGGLADMMNGENDSMMMAVLGGLLLLAAMILVVFIRRGRKKAYG